MAMGPMGTMGNDGPVDFHRDGVMWHLQKFQDRRDRRLSVKNTLLAVDFQTHHRWPGQYQPFVQQSIRPSDPFVQELSRAQFTS